MRSIRAYIIVALHMAAIMTGCNAQGPEESTETSAPSTTGSPFATAQSIVTEINRLADAGTISMSRSCDHGVCRNAVPARMGHIS